ncbi:RDD family protein [Sulfurimonas sp.]|uniref:RDD family protein n=1 Tax=Sulfurimonas sp. TaxID=2022749 RepID=UPI0025DA86E9|nr:RDD family protein [Sulfurimonas sp.]MBT5933957.1 RDD family protein [Sulfurimonas sp.]
MNEDIETLLHRESIVLAPIKKRAVAFMIDETLLSLLLIFALWDSFVNAQTMEEMINLTNSFVLEYMMMKFIYQAFFVMQYGATLGKMAMKIRVIELKTVANPNVLVSLNRSSVRILSETILYLGFLWGMLDPSRQAWHDKTARTLVVDA